MSVFLLAGCDKKKDSIFEDSSTIRLNASINNVYGILKAQPTWVFSYYPGANQEYGGFNLFPTFTNSTDVKFEAEYTNTSATNTFKVYAGAGPILTFDTYNDVIHYFGLPAYYTDTSTNTSAGIGAKDSGMKGDFEFLVLSANQDSIILKGRKSGNVMKMKSIQPAQLAATVANYKTANTRFNAYKAFSIEVNKLTLQTATSSATVSGTARLNRNLLVIAKNVTLKFIVTDTGLDFYQEYEIEGVKFNKLQYQIPTIQYPLGYYSNASNKLKLVPR